MTLVVAIPVAHPGLALCQLRSRLESDFQQLPV
jgi:hypothetical protein